MAGFARLHVRRHAYRRRPGGGKLPVQHKRGYSDHFVIILNIPIP